MTKPETVSCTDSFDTWQEAEERRQKLKNTDQYGLLCLWQSKDKQLWTVAPLPVLAAFMGEENT
jgi:hypothetical protein